MHIGLICADICAIFCNLWLSLAKSAAFASRRHDQRAGDFGPKVVELARSVYVNNDHRAASKRKINVFLGSKLIEE